jgi:hypothetical protein
MQAVLLRATFEPDPKKKGDYARKINTSQADRAHPRSPLMSISVNTEFSLCKILL